MPATLSANSTPRPAARHTCCAMISCSPGRRAQWFIVLCAVRRSALMMPADRSKLSRYAAVFLFIVIAIPGVARAATLEDSAKDLARRIEAALPAREKVQYEIRSSSSLKPEDVTRVEQSLNSELQGQGLRPAANGGAAPAVIITLSENWKDLIWTATFRQGDKSQAVLMAIPRPAVNQATSSNMPVTLRAERFWEGPQRILDAGLVSYTRIQSWLVLLLPDSVLIQNIQDGSTGKVEVPPGPSALRESMGSVGLGDNGNSVWFSLWAPPSMQICKVDLETRKLLECLPQDNRPMAARFPMMIDVAPAGPPPPGKGLELVIPPVCGGTTQFLASGDRDDTEPDSLQVFDTGPNGTLAVSAEQNFPGPIVALHTGLDAPRAIVRNLTTGNYEAYRLAISCGQ